MPYKSVAQRNLLHWKHPAIAKRWDKKYGTKIGGGHKKKSARKKTSRKTSRRR